MARRRRTVGRTGGRRSRSGIPILGCDQLVGRKLATPSGFRFFLGFLYLGLLSLGRDSLRTDGRLLFSFGGSRLLGFSLGLRSLADETWQIASWLFGGCAVAVYGYTVGIQ